MNKEYLAQTTTDFKVLQKLATDDDWRIRYEVARNSNTSPETLKVLSTDENSYIRETVAQNKNCPPDVYKYVQGRKILKNMYFS